MRKSRYTDSQILAILKQNEQGISVQELCREHGMSSAQFYKWRAKFGGMDASLMKRLKELEAERSIPLKSHMYELEFSGILTMQGDSDETIQVQRNPDHRDLERSRCRLER